MAGQAQETAAIVVEITNLREALSLLKELRAIKAELEGGGTPTSSAGISSTIGGVGSASGAPLPNLVMGGSE